MRCFVLYFVAVVLFSSPLFAQEDVRINEFLAVNDRGYDDEDFDEEDWIEIYNNGPASVNLNGWYLTDTPNNLTKWKFPTAAVPVILAPDSYLVVFASNKDRRDPEGILHTNFKLSSGGEYLALVKPDGVTVASEFSPAYPIQAPDVSYGYRGTSTQETFVAANAPAKALIPLNDDLEPSSDAPPETIRPWTKLSFDDSDSSWITGNTGVGYEKSTGYEAFINLDVGAMRYINATVYIRVPFTVEDPSAISSLSLRMMYDDGFIAYLNGREVAWDNSPDPSAATWNSLSDGNRDDDTVVSETVSFDITSLKDFLQAGTNVLAIQGLNQSVDSSDLLLLPELIATVSESDGESVQYFPQPSPGRANNTGIDILGPIIENEDHRPRIPTSSDSLQITASLRSTFDAIDTSSAQLHFRINFGSLITIPMLDDGNSGDEGIGDGVYGAAIPSSLYGPGDMVRWYITASDTESKQTRLPSYINALKSPEYMGTVVVDPSLTNPLPVLHWFIPDPASADNDTGTRCSLFYDGVFYDNLNINIHGQSSRGFPKKSYDIDFHPGYNFKWADGEPRADDINLLTTYPDKAHMRNLLAYELYRDTGCAYHWVLPVRVQQNGVFWGTAHIVENGDEDWLVRMGINSEGALYKMYNAFNEPTGEKKTRKDEGTQDLTAFRNGLLQSGTALNNYMYDNVDLPQVINLLATRALTGDVDCYHKNYYFYRDTGFSDEWQMWPWDVDLSYGREWSHAYIYWNHQMVYTTELNRTGGNLLVNKIIFSNTKTRAMYYRRFRTLMDEFLKPAGTPEEELYFEPRIAELAAMIQPDAELDAAKWNSHAWGNGSMDPNYPQTYPNAIADLTDVYFPARRNQLFNRIAGNTSEIPNAQPSDTVVNFGTIDYSPSSNNQDQEYIKIDNPNSIAVDISGWTITGGITFTFKGGTVISANDSIYLAANRKAFRARTVAPKGGSSLLVVGDYDGRLSARGEPLVLTHSKGAIIASTDTPSAPSLAQSFLRVTEIMYNPPSLPSDSFADEQEYEYIEIKNIGASTINLAGIHFSEGILFNFDDSSVTSLAAGDHLVIVKNAAAFFQRYPDALPISGQYTGSLDNGGERIRLDDASNEKILDFDYNNSWYPITDGRGFSLVIQDENTLFSDWDLATSWRPSAMEYGSPDADDTPVAGIPEILVNEVLTHTDEPQFDTIELYNPIDAEVNLAGWWLTDDPATPKKYQIPTNSLVPAGGYLTFDQNQFNAGGTGFALSAIGDEAYLYSASSSGELTGYSHGYSFGAAANGVSFGRYTDSQGETHFVAMDELTLLGANSEPKVGPVVISEIMYHPPQLLEGTNLVGNTVDEYIELENITGVSVPLYDPDFPVNTWRLRGDVDVDFPAGITLPANGHALIVPFNPADNPVALAAFRSKHNLPNSVPIIGPFSRDLDNGGDSLRLQRPDGPVPPPDPDAGTIPYILVDRVDYEDTPPWPIAADGEGDSLQRLYTSLFGNDPINWVAYDPNVNAPYSGKYPPVIRVQPQSLDQIVPVGGQAVFSAVWSGTHPFSQRWRRTKPEPVEVIDSFVPPSGGMVTRLIPGGYITATPTNGILVFTNVTFAQNGTAYDVAVYNIVGNTSLDPDATLTVVADSDGDGLSDSWEDSHAGFDSGNPADGVADEDKDGISNADEVISGTDYLDPDSYLRVEIAMPGTTAISFMAMANRTYSIEYSESLAPVSWKKLDHTIAKPRNHLVTMIDPASASSRVYRLVTPAQP